jgi:hypothetical protein
MARQGKQIYPHAAFRTPTHWSLLALNVIYLAPRQPHDLALEDVAAISAINAARARDWYRALPGHSARAHVAA